MLKTRHHWVLQTTDPHTLLQTRPPIHPMVSPLHIYRRGHRRSRRVPSHDPLLAGCARSRGKMPTRLCTTSNDGPRQRHHRYPPGRLSNPIIIRSQMSCKRKIPLLALFATSLILAGTTLFRIPNIVDRHGSQQYRSLLASVEILFATVVANALILGSFVRDRGVKKHRWKQGSLSDSIERSTSRRVTAVQHWGSDDGLVRDLGISLDPKLRGTPLDPSPMVSRRRTLFTTIPTRRLFSLASESWWSARTSV